MAKMSKYFPEEFLQEVLIRLPGRSLLRFRCVSKSFRALIDNINFHGMHYELSNLKMNTSIMFCEDKRKKLFTIDYKSVLSLLPLSASSTTMCEFANQMNYPSIFQDCGVEFLSACNGLVWMSRNSNRWPQEYYIWNPSTKVYKNIPMAREVHSNIYGYGFGYDYKLVRVVIDWASQCSVVDVYTLSSNSWKNTQSIPYLLFYGGAIYYGVLFNGGLHWLAHTFRKDSTVLVCFDIGSERFEVAVLPEAPIPYPEEPLEEDMFNLDVGVLGGCLCLIFHVLDVRVDVWMMQDYGVRKSWTKSFSITHESITHSTYLGLLWSFKSNEILWEIDRGLVLFEPKSKIYRELVLDSHYSERLTVAENNMPSSVSL